MTASNEGLDRRDFLKAAAGGGFALGSLLSLGLDLRAAQAEARHLRIRGVKEVPSVCPYCAVGCGQLVHVRGGRIINIEGNPSSPINEGTLCPKGAATFQLAVNDNRVTTVKYRRPGGTDWETRSLDWAMDRIARLTKQTRDESFVETRSLAELSLQSPATGVGAAAAGPLQAPPALLARKTVNHTLRIASLGGATMDNEWNYLQCKLMRA